MTCRCFHVLAVLSVRRDETQPAVVVLFMSTGRREPCLPSCPAEAAGSPRRGTWEGSEPATLGCPSAPPSPARGRCRRGAPPPSTLSARASCGQSCAADIWRPASRRQQQQRDKQKESSLTTNKQTNVGPSVWFVTLSYMSAFRSEASFQATKKNSSLMGSSTLMLGSDWAPTRTLKMIRRKDILLSWHRVSNTTSEASIWRRVHPTASQWHYLKQGHKITSDKPNDIYIYIYNFKFIVCAQLKNDYSHNFLPLQHCTDNIVRNLPLKLI